MNVNVANSDSDNSRYHRIMQCTLDYECSYPRFSGKLVIETTKGSISIDARVFNGTSANQWMSMLDGDQPLEVEDGIHTITLQRNRKLFTVVIETELIEVESYCKFADVKESLHRVCNAIGWLYR